MSKPDWLKTKIFLDSGDPKETRQILNLMGFLDGQTTNPSLVARHPEVQARLKNGEKFTRNELWEFYKTIVCEISACIPNGSVSIEAYADQKTGVQEILDQTREMFTWIPNAHIKMPITKSGLEAAHKAIALSIRVNMTLCFSQEQAAAVYVATQLAKRGGVFISPFIGRLDDSGFMGTDLVENIMRMFYDPIHPSDEHVEILAASVRNINDFFHILRLGVDIVTCPYKVLEEWAKEGFLRPENNFRRNCPDLKRIRYNNYTNFARNWYDMNIGHELTEKGLQKFADDWNLLIKD